MQRRLVWGLTPFAFRTVVLEHTHCRQHVAPRPHWLAPEEHITAGSLHFTGVGSRAVSSVRTSLLGFNFAVSFAGAAVMERGFLLLSECLMLCSRLHSPALARALAPSSPSAFFPLHAWGVVTVSPASDSPVCMLSPSTSMVSVLAVATDNWVRFPLAGGNIVDVCTRATSPVSLTLLPRQVFPWDLLLQNLNWRAWLLLVILQFDSGPKDASASQLWSACH